MPDVSLAGVGCSAVSCVLGYGERIDADVTHGGKCGVPKPWQQPTHDRLKRVSQDLCCMHDVVAPI